MPTSVTTEGKVSNYTRYQQAPFNHPDYYAIEQTPDPSMYRPVASWMGRLILPSVEQRTAVRGCLFEVYHADAEHDHLVGQVVALRWSDAPRVREYLNTVTRDVNFNQKALQSIGQGLVLPERLNGWKQVDPLESLAGSRPYDDMVVALPDPVVVEAGADDGVAAVVCISFEPVQISGRFYALVSFVGPAGDEGDQFRVVHFNRASRRFDGAEELVRMPPVIPDQNNIDPSTSRDIEKSPLNADGWYIYGAQDHSGMFVVQALVPRALLRLQPDSVILDRQAALRYLRKGSWAESDVLKGRVSSVLLSPTTQDRAAAVAGWREGDRALLLHVYGGIGGNKREAAAIGGLHFGHFAYGIVRMWREPLADEVIFDITYYQIYTHNVDGLIAGALAWSRYMGDRQFGWAGTRPATDVLLRLDAFTDDYDFGEVQQSGLGVLRRKLETMAARYRIGDGTGATYVGPANNCSQDSNQALYTAMRFIEESARSLSWLQDWMRQNPEQSQRFQRLLDLEKSLKQKLLPWGSARADWREGKEGLNIEEDPLTQIWLGLRSWRTVFPRTASNRVASLFLDHGASAWVLRTVQVGGRDPDIEPITPLGL